MLGLGLILDHATPDTLVGRSITVEVAAIGDSVNFRLEGRITHAAPTLRGAARIGVEFDALFEPAQEVRPVESVADRASGGSRGPGTLSDPAGPHELAGHEIRTTGA